MLSDPYRILVLVAAPRGTPPLGAIAELKTIRLALQPATRTKAVVVDELLAATPAELRGALLAAPYDLVHFVAHGERGAIVLETETHERQAVPARALGDLFAAFVPPAGSLRCVVLNACYALSSAHQAARAVPLVIAADGLLRDDVALAFAQGFYTALANRRDVPAAYEQGRGAAERAFPGDARPTLLERSVFPPGEDALARAHYRLELDLPFERAVGDAIHVLEARLSELSEDRHLEIRTVRERPPAAGGGVRLTLATSLAGGARLQEAFDAGEVCSPAGPLPGARLRRVQPAGLGIDAWPSSAWSWRLSGHSLPLIPPLGLRAFVGREQELAQLRAWWNAADAAPLLSLLGEEGSGRSTLLARWLSEPQERALPGRILVWSFEQDDRVERLLAACLATFAGERGTRRGGLERLRQALAEGGPHLLVLDGLERLQSDGADGRVPGALQAHTLRLLLRLLARGADGTRAIVTASRPLADLVDRGGVQAVTVGPLAAAPSQALLARWQPELAATARVELAATAEGQPLLLALIGQLFRRAERPAAEEALRGGLAAVTAGAARDERVRARIESVLAAHRRLLGLEAQALVGLLSLFPRGATLDELSRALAPQMPGKAGLQPERLPRLLDELPRGLVIERREALAASPEVSLRYCLPAPVRTFFRRDSWVAADGFLVDVLRVLAGELQTRVNPRLGRFLSSPEDLDRCETIIHQALEAKQRLLAANLALVALGGVGHLGWKLGEYARGERIFSAIAAQPAPPGSPAATERSLFNVQALFHEALGDLPAAGQAFTRAVAAERFGRVPERIATYQAAESLRMQGRLPEALALVREVLDAPSRVVRRTLLGRRQPSRPRDEAGTLIRLANVLHALGEVVESRATFARAQEAAGGSFSSIYAVWRADCLADLGEHEAAEELLQANVRVMQLQASGGRDEALSRTVLGRLVRGRSAAEAADHLAWSRSWVRRCDHLEVVLRNHQLAALLALDGRRAGEARAEADEGADLAESCGFRLLHVQLLVLGGRARLAGEEAAPAIELARCAERLATDPSCAYAWGRAEAIHLAGAALARAGRRDEAVAALREALALRTRLGHPGRAHSASLLAELGAGDEPRADPETTPSGREPGSS